MRVRVNAWPSSRYLLLEGGELMVPATGAPDQLHVGAYCAWYGSSPDEVVILSLYVNVEA